MHSENFTLLPLKEGATTDSSFTNCLKNNYRHLKKWATRTKTSCFRLYHKQLHHIPLIIDVYGDQFTVQFLSKGKQEEGVPQELVILVENAFNTLFGVSSEAIHWRIRSRKKTARQYEKQNEVNQFFIVYEYGVKFLVNLTDYIDTGLFLDHRETRQMVAKASAQKSLLNLFAYTCSFSVQAAVMGATFTKSVDLSNTYTAWGKENFKENGLSLKNHPIVRADCLKFLDEEIRTSQKYDVIVIDPPTISRSKKMDQFFDVTVDSIPLIQKSLRLLHKGGTLFFSTNARGFLFNEQWMNEQKEVSFVEITKQTIPIDFQGETPHRCWKIQK